MRKATMPKIEMSVSSLICMLIGVQVVVSMVVIGTITYMNNVYMIPGQLVSSWDKLPPSFDNYKTVIEVDVTKSNYSRSLEFHRNPNSSWGLEHKENQLPGEGQVSPISKIQRRTPISPLPIDEKPQPPANGFVILTSVNGEFVDIAENWLESVRRLGLRYNITLVAEDEDTYKYFSIRANREFRILYQKQYAFNFTRRYAPAMMYQELIRRRTVYIRTLLEQGSDVLLVDVDTVWIRNPVDLVLREYSAYDLWLAQGFENAMPCPCFMYMKATSGVVALVREWVKRLENQRGRRLESDQVALTKTLPLFPDVPTKRMSFASLPTGKHYFDRSWLALHKHEVYVAHGNHLGRHDSKKEKLKEFGLWLLKS